jgi:amino acid adenylation domain-containing protein
VDALCRRKKASRFMALAAVFDVALARLCREANVVVGVPVANRSGADTSDVVGLFTHTLPISVRVDERGTFAALVEQKRNAILEAMEHSVVSLEGIALPRLSRRSLLRVIFSDNASSAYAGSMDRSISHDFTGATAFDLTVEVCVAEGDRIAIKMFYSEQILSAVTVQALADECVRLLRQVVAKPDVPLVQLARAHDPAAIARRPDKGGTPMLTSALHGASSRDDLAVAVVDGELAVTYEQLRRRSDALALEIRLRTSGSEAVVGVHLKRCADLVVALFAVLKAGCVYLALEPGQPVDRLRFQAEDSRCQLVVDAAGTEATWADPHFARLSVHHSAALATKIDYGAPMSTSLAYVVYTSGSTGNPKGVAVTREGLDNFIRWYVDEFAVTREDRATQLVSIGCDASLLDIFPVLAAGGCVIFVPDEIRLDAEQLWKFYDQHRITISFVVTPTMHALADCPPPAVASMRRLLVGGERLLRVPDPRPCPIANVYGPSEYTIAATSAWIAEDLSDIGCPLRETAGHVLDQWLRPVPTGWTGELYLAGPGVARGYVNSPGLTAARFVPDPFRADGSRMYRSGDVVLKTEHSRFSYRGRTDAQVKVRGFRVELGEVEEQLRACCGSRELAVIFRSDLPGAPGLVAFIEGDRAADASWLESAKARLRKTLPAHMVPTRFEVISALPLNANGKIDRQLLARAPLNTGFIRSGDRPDPEGPVQALVADIWRRLLEVPKVTASDNFFDLGGHSLLVARMVAQLNRELGLVIPLSLPFEHQTLDELADQVELLIQAELGSHEDRAAIGSEVDSIA